MSKFFRTAALVVGVAAIVVATGGFGAAPAVSLGTTVTATGTVTAATVAATSASVFGLTAGTLAAISTGLSVAAQLTAKRPSTVNTPSQTQFSGDPSSGIPIMIARTYFSGRFVHRETYGEKRKWQSFVTIYSGAGPIQEIESFHADRAPVPFDGSGNAIGGFHNYMYFNAHLGQTPEAAALAAHFPGFPAWSSSSKLSGYASSMWTLVYDKKGDKFPSGPPAPAILGKGILTYDPRLDSTYPGGSGSHRWADPRDKAAHAAARATWTWSENPWVHALNWALGYWHCDPNDPGSSYQRVGGAGVKMNRIIVSSFVEAMNVADANNWKCGGIVWTTENKWEVMRQFAQAGGGEVMRLGARLMAFVNAPKVSLATITSADLKGEGSLTATQGRLTRINSVVPKVRLESHGWEMVPLMPVTVPAYEAEDGGRRTEPVDYPLVQDKDQGAQLAMYEIVNAREFGPITLPLGPRWVGYVPGDCLTLDIPQAGLAGQKAVMRGRGLNLESGIFTQVFRSESDAKHAFALGKTGTPPPTPDLTVAGIDDVDPPEAVGNLLRSAEFQNLGAGTWLIGSELSVLDLTALAAEPTAYTATVQDSVLKIPPSTNASTGPREARYTRVRANPGDTLEFGVRVARDAACNFNLQIRLTQYDRVTGLPAATTDAIDITPADCAVAGKFYDFRMTMPAPIVPDGTAVSFIIRQDTNAGGTGIYIAESPFVRIA